MKKTRIRKKAKGLGIVHCTGRRDGDASGARFRVLSPSSHSVLAPPPYQAFNGAGPVTDPRSSSHPARCRDPAAGERVIGVTRTIKIPFEIWDLHSGIALRANPAPRTRAPARRHPKALGASPVQLREERGKQMTAWVTLLRRRRKTRPQGRESSDSLPKHKKRGSKRLSKLSISTHFVRRPSYG